MDPELKKTAGKIYSDLRSKQQDQLTVFDAVQAIGNDMMPKLVAMIDKDKQKSECDFYVEVCICMNPILGDVPEFKMISRYTCPTPFPDRAVFRYDKKKDAIFFLWHVPSEREIQYYRDNMLFLRPDEKEAARNAFDYQDGTLLRRAKELNGEINDYDLTFFRKDGNGQPITS